MIPTTRVTTQQWVSHTAPTLSMYHSQNSSCEVGFDIPPLQALNLSPLAWEVDLLSLPTWAEVYDISWVLHCFDVALAIANRLTSTSLIDDSSILDKLSDEATYTILWMIHCINCIGKKKHTLANKTTPKVNGT